MADAAAGPGAWARGRAAGGGAGADAAQPQERKLRLEGVKGQDEKVQALLHGLPCLQIFLAVSLVFVHFQEAEIALTLLFAG